MSTPRIALIPHDAKKHDSRARAGAYRATLAQCRLVATGTTGGRIAQAHGLDVERNLAGPRGGALQIGAELADGRVDIVIFLRDPMTAQPHDPDITALVRACDVHDVPVATNVATARVLLDDLARRLTANA